jgi:nucleotide-binding universal stress UspA family protein
MKKNDEINKVLVCLDLTEIDEHLIQYASFISQTLNVNKVTFIHIIQAYDLPDRSGKELPQIETSLNKNIKEEIGEVSNSKFQKETKIDVITKIEDEDAANIIIDFVNKEDFNLVLIGQKFGQDREGRYGQKIAASIDTDIMFVPQGAHLSFDNIFCALDLSKASEGAFRLARNFAKKTNNKLSCYYIFDTSKSYFPASTLQSYSALENKAKKKFQKFLNKQNINESEIDFYFTVEAEAESQARKVYEKAKTLNASVIIIGAKGNTNTVTSLLGNVTENFRQIEKEIPVLIIQNPDKKGLISL